LYPRLTEFGLVGQFEIVVVACARARARARSHAARNLNPPTIGNRRAIAVINRSELRGIVRARVWSYPPPPPPLRLPVGQAFTGRSRVTPRITRLRDLFVVSRRAEAVNPRFISDLARARRFNTLGGFASRRKKIRCRFVGRF